MAEILDQLGSDHRRMAYLLDLLERELDAMGKAKDADVELMRLVMMYMTRYPDAVHHPKEDLLFAHLSTVDSTLSEIIDQLESEHEILATTGAELLATLVSVVDGGIVEREVVTAQGAAYIDLLRRHMHLESDGVFQAAAQLLPDTAWSAVAAAYAEQQDPLFGPIVEQDFKSLFDVIQRDSAGARLG